MPGSSTVAEPLVARLPGQTMRAASILSVATRLPERAVTNAELGSELGVSEEWILSRTGIRARLRAAPEDRLADYAAEAGAQALERAGVLPGELDLVLVATMTQDELTPNTAPLVAHALGAARAGAIDIGAACTGFLSGLGLAAAQIESGRAESILLIGADFISRITDHDDRRTAPLFADAAGAVVIGPSDGCGAVGPTVLRADGSHARTLHATHAERVLRMDGPEVFRHAVARMSEVTVAAADAAGLALGDIDLFVYHQANARITRAIGERLGVDPGRVVDCIELLGNASAATLPVALAAAEREGRLAPGARVLLSAFGAGFTWGGTVIQWPEVSGG